MMIFNTGCSRLGVNQELKTPMNRARNTRGRRVAHSRGFRSGRLAFFGFVLCLVYDRTGSLYTVIAVHAVNNALAFGSALGWDWQILPVAAGALAVIAIGARSLERLQRAA